jgi:acyl carrier protein
MMNAMKATESSADLLPVVINLIHSVSAKAKQLEITSHSLLLEELALDSLDLVRVLMLIEDRYQVAIDLDEVPKLKQVRDLTILLGRELRSAA